MTILSFDCRLLPSFDFSQQSTTDKDDQGKINGWGVLEEGESITTEFFVMPRWLLKLRGYGINRGGKMQNGAAATRVSIKQGYHPTSPRFTRQSQCGGANGSGHASGHERKKQKSGGDMAELNKAAIDDVEAKETEGTNIAAASPY